MPQPNGNAYEADCGMPQCRQCAPFRYPPTYFPPRPPMRPGGPPGRPPGGPYCPPICPPRPLFPHGRGAGRPPCRASAPHWPALMLIAAGALIFALSVPICFWPTLIGAALIIGGCLALRA